ncbi:helix-turn-helix domain-containing protein [Roseococcus pinisoli]|uniref:Uncharacterized protein n=1 Tax=Roseococcus pinisoli TaxID=2835040 RepID=A0ABS5QAG3_9PROT|nr:hypothetical protein [Roseococcus pinisoli]MBS7810519.1 hypothetical protein [Roseococcus pinisoli]
MTLKLLGLEQVYALIKSACAAAGGQKAWARHYGLAPSSITEVLHGRRDPGPGLLRALGLQHVPRYAKVRIPNR